MSWARNFFEIPLSCLQPSSWHNAQKRPQLIGSVCAAYIGWLEVGEQAREQRLEAGEQKDSRLARIAKSWIGMGIGAYAEGMTRFCFESPSWKWVPSSSVPSLICRSVVSGFVPALGCVTTIEIGRLAFKAIFRGAPFTKKTDRWANLIRYTFTAGALMNAGGKAAEIWANRSGDLAFMGAWYVGMAAVVGVSLGALKLIERKARPEITFIEHEIRRIPLLMECAHA